MKSRLLTLGVLPALAYAATLHACGAVAHASEVAPVSGGSALEQLVLQQILPALAIGVATIVLPVIGLLVHRLNQWLGQHAATRGLAISAEMEARLQSLAAQGCALAEEKAAAALKAKIDAYQPSLKARIASEFVLKMAEHYNLPALSQEKADALVHAYLGATPGVGASTTPAPAAA